MLRKPSASRFVAKYFHRCFFVPGSRYPTPNGLRRPGHFRMLAMAVPLHLTGAKAGLKTRANARPVCWCLPNHRKFPLIGADPALPLLACHGVNFVQTSAQEPIRTRCPNSRPVSPTPVSGGSPGR